MRIKTLQMDVRTRPCVDEDGVVLWPEVPGRWSITLAEGEQFRDLDGTYMGYGSQTWIMDTTLAARVRLWRVPGKDE